MRWFRSHIRFGSRLALFALAVQIVLSFAHVHLGNIASAAAPALIEQSSAVPGGPSAPTHHQNGAADTGCPICALIQLAATSTPAAAPALPPPSMLGQRRLEVPGVATLTALPPVRFRARAPPAA